MVLLRGRGLDLFAVALCVPVLVLAIAAHGVTARAAAASWPVDNLGQPVQRALSTDTALGVTPDGDPQAFFLNQGNYSDQTSEFVAVDLRTQQIVFDGLADSTLFEFDLATRQILGSKALATSVDGSMYGIEHQLLFDHGRLFATDDEQLFHIDTVTWAVQTLYSGPASNLTQDRYGQLYFVQNPSYVYRYDLPTTAYMPAASARTSYQDGHTTVDLQAAEPGGVGIQEIDYRVDGGSWQVYSGPFTVAGRHVIEYRAVDNAWSASAVQTLSVGPGR